MNPHNMYQRRRTLEGRGNAAGAMLSPAAADADPVPLVEEPESSREATPHPDPRNLSPNSSQSSPARGPHPPLYKREDSVAKQGSGATVATPSSSSSSSQPPPSSHPLPLSPKHIHPQHRFGASHTPRHSPQLTLPPLQTSTTASNNSEVQGRLVDAATPLPDVPGSPAPLGSLTPSSRLSHSTRAFGAPGGVPRATQLRPVGRSPVVLADRSKRRFSLFKGRQRSSSSVKDTADAVEVAKSVAVRTSFHRLGQVEEGERARQQVLAFIAESRVDSLTDLAKLLHRELDTVRLTIKKKQLSLMPVETAKALGNGTRAPLGPLAREVGQRWLQLSGALDMRAASQYAYQDYLDDKSELNPDDSTQIEKDLNRTQGASFTVPSMCQFLSQNDPDEVRRKQTRVLTAYARRNHLKGYAQGMDQISLFLLSLQEEEEVFWTLCVLVERMRLPDFYNAPPAAMNGYLIEVKVIRRLARHVFPRMFATLKDDLDNGLELLSPKWFISLFVDNVSLDCLVLIWDHFFLHGGDPALTPAIFAILMNAQHTMFGATGALKGEDPEASRDVFLVLSKVMHQLTPEEIHAACVDPQYRFNPSFIRELREEARQQIALDWNRGMMGPSPRLHSKRGSQQSAADRKKELRMETLADSTAFSQKQLQAIQLAVEMYFDTGTGPGPPTSVFSTSHLDDGKRKPKSVQHSTQSSRRGSIQPPVGLSIEQFTGVLRQALPHLPVCSLPDHLFSLFCTGGSPWMDFQHLLQCLSMLYNGGSHSRYRMLFDAFDNDRTGILEQHQVDLSLQTMVKVYCSHRVHRKHRRQHRSPRHSPTPSAGSRRVSRRMRQMDSGILEHLRGSLSSDDASVRASERTKEQKGLTLSPTGKEKESTASSTGDRKPHDKPKGLAMSPGGKDKAGVAPHPDRDRKKNKSDHPPSPHPPTTDRESVGSEGGKARSSMTEEERDEEREREEEEDGEDDLSPEERADKEYQGVWQAMQGVKTGREGQMTFAEFCMVVNQRPHLIRGMEPDKAMLRLETYRQTDRQTDRQRDRQKRKQAKERHDRGDRKSEDNRRRSGFAAWFGK